MKKIIILLLIVLACMLPDPPADAGTCVAQGAGNWSNTATWGTTCNGSTAAIPSAGDDVQLAGYVITWDIGTAARIPASGTLGTITTTAAAGQIAVDIGDAACHDAHACSINATTITAGTKPATAGVILTSNTGASTDHSLDINAAIVGGSNSGSVGVNHAVVGIVNITGPVTGGSSTSCHGASNGSTGVLNVAGTVTGGTGIGSVGYVNASTGTGTITGDVVGSSSASYNTMYGVSASGTGHIALTGNLVDNTSVAWSGHSPIWTPGNTYYHQLIDGTKLYVSTDPGVANVKTGTGYYIQGSSLTGTMSSGSSGGAWSF